jgi:NAD(P)H dehydrogenase (quinone)
VIGPIAITGASGQVGTLLRKKLAESRAEVIALNRGAEWNPSIRSAAVVVHLAGTLLPKGKDSYESANVGTTKAVATGVRGSDVKRIVFLSYVGAAADSENAYLRAKARAEQALLDSGVQTTIFRCLHIYGSPERPGPTAEAFLARGRRAVVVPGDGEQRIAPLYVGDVVSAVVAAASSPDAPSGTFDLGGPDEMSMDEFVGALNGGEARIRHLPVPLARVLAHLSPSSTPALIDLLLRDNVIGSDPNRVAAEFGFSLHRLEDAWGGGNPIPGRNARDVEGS